MPVLIDVNEKARPDRGRAFVLSWIIAGGSSVLQRYRMV